MKQQKLLLYFPIILQFCACSNDLDSYNVVSNPIPLPTPTTIVYTSIRENTIHLRVSNSDYAKSYRLTSFGLATMPDWSPDKRWIAYTYGFQIWTMRYDGTKKQLLTPSGIEAQAPRFSPDGNKLIFIVTLPEGRYTLYTMHRNGGQLRQVVSDSMISKTGQYSFIWPDWSADGKRICFSYARLDTNFLQSYIGILNLDTKIFTRVTWSDTTLLPREPRWSPRRDELLVACSLRENGIDIWRVNLDGTNPTRLTYTKRSRAPEWSGDGEYFLYETHIDNIRTIWKMKRDGSGNERIIIDGHPYGAEPAW